LQNTIGIIRGVAIGLAVLLGTARAQGPQFKKLPPPSKFKNPPLLETTIHVRDAFIDRLAQDGFYCRLPAPAIVVADTPLFGEWEKNTDNLITPDWVQLKPEEQAVFTQLAGPGSTDKQARDIFEMEAHHWIFIVETVHWWEGCKQLTLKLTPYQAELQAARVALAYWRERDPAVVQQLVAIGDMLAREPSPVPAGQDFATYFNQHYQTTASGKEYLWIQSQFLKELMAEDPEPAVVQAVNQLK
jgi:hypothetical protein